MGSWPVGGAAVKLGASACPLVSSTEPAMAKDTPSREKTALLWHLLETPRPSANRHTFAQPPTAALTMSPSYLHKLIDNDRGS